MVLHSVLQISGVSLGNLWGISGGLWGVYLGTSGASLKALCGITLTDLWGIFGNLWGIFGESLGDLFFLQPNLQ